MQFLIDHLLAIIISGVVILILIVNQVRTLDEGLEDTSVYMAKKYSLDLAEIIEEDFNMTLHRYNTSREPFDWGAMTTDAAGRTTFFKFYRDSVDLSTSETVRLETRYSLNFVDSLYTTMVDGVGNSSVVSEPLFELVREECQTTASGTACGTGWDFAGNSAPWVQDFKIVPLRQNQQLATSVAETHYLKVSFTMSPPIRTERQVIDKLQWSALRQVRPF